MQIMNSTFKIKNQEVIIKECDIILVHKLQIKSIGDLASPIIRKFTNCYYNHSAIVVKYLDELYVAEAVDNGFVPTTSLIEYLDAVGEKREIAILRIKPKYGYTTEKIYTNIKQLVNHKYGYGTLIFTQLVYQITKKLFGKGWWLGKSGNAAKRTVVCSEVIAYAFTEQFTGIEYRITPADLYLSDIFTIEFESRKF